MASDRRVVLKLKYGETYQGRSVTFQAGFVTIDECGLDWKPVGQLRTFPADVVARIDHLPTTKGPS